ncbi:DEAD/DEAH box helicase [Limibaculum sp. M0105]|uniref:DEAD-box ATP-dependent RNA helicase RhpA n=1 Tax=Thermohalobaculum xanthum TaxID=2753746 RepID=A0A8J7M5I4_9RHOB|nr:DEAD/DEAH box helicase [Thermohalobaculum xanthum]MBK0397794.1 DEAD/DEAH box helicase [Thermohalobaculum xanthum]
MKFSELELDPKVLQAVEEAGYETPTPIQAQAIPEALKGRDVLGIAQTGTGKTASFTLPMISLLAKGRARARMPRSLILCPTRELAAQVAENFEIYGKYHKLTMALLIGGVSFKDQDKLIDRGVDVLIATPGRLLDHFERGKLMLTGVQVMVVDEADRMLDMGFIPDIERIFSLTPFTRQTLFFSATMPPEITRLTEQFLHNPIRIEVARQASTAETVTQGVCMFRPSRRDKADTEKRALLRAMIDGEGDKFRNAIVFCNRKRDVGILFKSLQKYGYNCGALHGDLDQSVRTATLNAFRDGGIKILVASDVAARGLDIPNVSHVFNFDLPMHAEDYVHRIGRTGRAGREGIALAICSPYDQKYLDKIEELIGKQVPRRELPEGVVAPEQPEAAETIDEERRDRRRRGGDSRKRRGDDADAPAQKQQNKSEAPAPSSEDTTPRRAPERDRRRGEKRDDKPVVGLGDHVPDFLLRPVPVRSTRKSASSQTEGQDEDSDSEAA